MTLIDFHAHSLLKPFNSSVNKTDKKSLWYEFDVPETCASLNCMIQKGVKDTDKQSQADFTKLKIGGVNGVVIAMGPAERPFFKPKITDPVVYVLLPSKDFKNMARCVTGFCMEKVIAIFSRIAANEGVNYFTAELQEEFKYIMQQQASPDNSGNKFQIATDYDQFKNIIDNQPDTIAVVLSVEGAHAFGKYEHETDFAMTYEEVQNMNDYSKFKFIENIRTMKKEWADHTPFFVTLCHHFWNLLSGHSKSMSPTRNWFRPGMDAMINQLPNMNMPITKIGEEVIAELLSRENGRRILIDIKHMSVPARKRYYEIVAEKKRSGDNIPIICSHTSVNLFETMDEAASTPDDFDKDKDAYLSRFSINLSNDEIRNIADSNGIIGIILNEGRMPGEKGRDAIKACGDDMDKKRDVYVKLIMCNILQIVKTVNRKEAWDMICIGSDFDGVIDPFETYVDARTLGDLPVHIMQYLSHPVFDLDWIGVTAQDIKTRYMFGYTPQQIGEKISSGNIMLFLERYFNNVYLRGNPVAVASVIP